MRIVYQALQKKIRLLDVQGGRFRSTRRLGKKLKFYQIRVQSAKGFVNFCPMHSNCPER